MWSATSISFRIDSGGSLFGGITYPRLLAVPCNLCAVGNTCARPVRSGILVQGPSDLSRRMLHQNRESNSQFIPDSSPSASIEELVDEI
jgi:hypothetical protein